MAVHPLTREDELYWLALRLVPGLGARRAGQLLQEFHTPRLIFRASRSELEAAGLMTSVAQSIVSGCVFDDAVLQQEKMIETGASLLTRTDSRYPARLGEIYDPPVLLFARGRLELLDSVMVAVVGTRRPTPYGVAAAERLSGDLAHAGVTIVSGMARGVDTAAHRAVLAAGGNTVAVLGCGVDVIYPTENRRLMGEIAFKGLVLSEFPMGSPAYPQNFPVRNRIVSGLSAGVLVIEGAQYSGSAITARLAMDQGREVFAVPGNITSKMSWGPNLLIKQGAKLVQEWSDVTAELPPEERRLLAEQGRKRLADAQIPLAETETGAPASNEMSTLAPVSHAVLRLLQPDAPTHIDVLLERLEDHSSSELIAALFELELLGMVKQLPGKQFVKTW